MFNVIKKKKIAKEEKQPALCGGRIKKIVDRIVEKKLNIKNIRNYIKIRIDYKVKGEKDILKNYNKQMLMTTILL